ncbi:MAG: GDP-mannose 4,6-dehydratase, partial [bacterium]
WVAWFTIASVLNKDITFYGNGKQVRDVLYVDDLIRAYSQAADQIETTSGRIYNIGGGPDNTTSLLELIELLEDFEGREIPVDYDEWRTGDQKIYVSDINKAKSHFGWDPRYNIEEGLEQ